MTTALTSVRLIRVLRWCAITLLLALAIVHLSSTFSTVSVYTLKNAYQDQFRLYLRYLTVPFPLSIFELENGHRPVLPALLRWLELTFLHGAQTLQFTTAWLAALAATGGLLRVVWRDLDGVRVATAICAIAVTVLWNANARMFIHAYEATHVFYIYAALVAAVGLISYGAEVSFKRLAMAGACGVVATFSFGPGIVVFPTILCLLVLRRAKIAQIAQTALLTAAVFVAYSYLLPGADGVRGSSSGFSALSAAKFEALRFGAYWLELLAGSWPIAEPMRLLTASGSVLVIALSCQSVVRRWLRREEFSRSTLFAVGLAAFGIVTNAVIAVNRVSHFQANPGDVLAERYLIWSALLWLGVGLYWLSVPIPRATLRTSAVAVLAIAVAVVGIQRANWWRSWASSTYRIVELTATAYQRGIEHPHRLVEVATPDMLENNKSVTALRAAKVMVFGDDSESWLLREIGVESASVGLPAFQAWQSPDTGDLPPGSAWRIVGTEIPRLTAHRLRAAHFWVADAKGRVVGDCARTGSKREPSDYARYFRPIYNRIDCYVLREAGSQLRLVSTHHGTASVIGALTIPESPM